MDKKQEREHARTHIDPKLRRSLRMFLVISAVLLIAVIYEALHYHAIYWEIGLGLAVGILFGSLFSRMYKISWDKDANHVSNNIDIYGIVILILYVTFDLLRGHIVNVFTHNEAVPAISLALLAGTMYGRVLGSGHIIVKILKRQEVFSRHHQH